MRDVAECAMKAAVQVADRTIEYMDVAASTPGRGQVRVQSLGTSICGSDQHVWRGEFAGRVV